MVHEVVVAGRLEDVVRLVFLPDDRGQLPQGTEKVKTTLPFRIRHVGRLDIGSSPFHVPCQVTASFPDTQAIRGIASVALASVHNLREPQECHLRAQRIYAQRITLHLRHTPTGLRVQAVMWKPHVRANML